MNRRAVTTVAIIALALLVAVAPGAAQGIEGPLLEKVDEKTDQATTDPTGFATQQATDGQLAQDANWTIAYACYVTYTASDEAGIPPPGLERCRDFEEALGIAEEEEDAAQEAEEAVADAEALQDSLIIEAEALVEDAARTLGAVVDDPTTALDALLGFLDRTGRALGRILDALVDFVQDTIDGIADGLGILAKGAGLAVAAPVVGVLWLAGATGTVAMNAVQGIGAAITTVGDGVVAAVEGVVGGASAAGGAMGDACGAVIDAVGEVLRDIFGEPTTQAEKDGTLDGLSDKIPADPGGLLDDAGRLVDDTTHQLPA